MFDENVFLPIGTITWYKCEDQLPPKKDNPYSYSDQVIASDGKNVQMAIYCHNPAQGLPYWHIHATWQPTHWAFINLPK